MYATRYAMGRKSNFTRTASRSCSAQAANRLGSWSGLMAQAAHGSAVHLFDDGDIKTAQLFGQNFAKTLNAYQGVQI